MRNDAYSVRLFGAVAGLAVFAGCTFQHGTGGDAGTEVVYFEGEPNTMVSGFAYDPEAFFFSVATWPCDEDEDPDCEQTPPPIAMSFSPHLRRSYVIGASVTAVEPEGFSAVSPESAPSRFDGLWVIPQMATVEGTPLMLRSSGGEGLSPGSPPPLPPDLFPIPEADYFPTVRAGQFDSSPNGCIGQEMPVISNKGFLQAVANALSEDTPVTPEDLMDPAKFGGVVVVWMQRPGPPFLYVPANGTELTASSGTVFHLAFAPPGIPGLPPFITATQSERGYFVFPQEIDPGSPLGLAVVVFPPEEADTLVEVTTHDLVDSEPEERPWPDSTYTLPVRPGEVVYARVQLAGVAPGFDFPFYCNPE